MKRFFVTTGCMLVMAICTAQSQAELNQNAGNDFKQADKELNQVYQQVLKEYGKQVDFIKSLKASQKIWIQFRDAEMLAKYPKSQQKNYGSVFPLCWSSYKAQLTRERTKTLRVWLDGIEEGDTCSGSVKIKQ